MGQFIGVSIAVFLVIILVLVAMLLIAKKYLSPSGKVTITVNGDKKLEVEQGGSLLSTLNESLKAVARFSTPRRATSRARR